MQQPKPGDILLAPSMGVWVKIQRVTKRTVDISPRTIKPIPISHLAPVANAPGVWVLVEEPRTQRLT
jgi:hypothetical protein